jgi:hypothetical protein
MITVQFEHCNDCNEVEVFSRTSGYRWWCKYYHRVIAESEISCEFIEIPEWCLVYDSPEAGSVDHELPGGE